MHSEETNYCTSAGPVCASETLWPFKSSLNVDAFVLRGRKQEKDNRRFVMGMVEGSFVSESHPVR